MPDYIPDLASRKEAEYQAELRRHFGADAAAQRAAALRDREFAEREAARAKQVAAWDAADRKEREEREKRREADRLARVTAAEDAFKARSRAAYLEQPGSTPDGFARDYPELLKRHRI